MQERSIAARQREAMRRNAKREARKMAKQNKLPPSGRKVERLQSCGDQNLSFQTAASDVHHDNDNGSKHTAQSKANSVNSSTTPARAALDYAIQRGDWEAVGRTAEQLCEGSVSETSEYHSADDRSFLSSKSTPSSSDADRTIELEGLIENGDWSGVVAAASRYTKTDKSINNETSKVTYEKGTLINSKLTRREFRKDDAFSLSTEAKKEKTLREEKDALAQAEIWMTVAAQSKNENSNATKGASEAADWAISRSLLQIQASSADDKQDMQSIASSCDDKSV